MNQNPTPQHWEPHDRAQKFDSIDPLLEREVTITISGQWPADFSTSSREKVLRKAQGWARLSHPNVVQLYDLQLKDESLFLITERHRGPDLQAFLEGSREDYRLGPPDVRRLIEGLACALHYAHGYGVVHGEISPSQVLLCSGGKVQLLRFAPEVLDGWTFADKSVPTLAYYQTPQQIVGLEATPADDIYALGVLMYRLLVGAYPFDSGSFPILVDQILNRIPEGIEVPPGFPAETGVAIARCLAKDPVDRFSSVEEFLKYLYPDATLPALDAARIRDIDRKALQFLRQKRYQEALALWRDASKLEPHDGRLVNNVGVALCRLERFEEAEVEFRKAAELLAWEGHVRFHLGWVLWKLGSDEARPHLEKAIKSHPKLLDPYLLLSRITRGQDQLDFLQRAALLHPKNQAVHLALADALISLGKGDDALKHQEYAKQLAPVQDEFRPRHMALVEWEHPSLEIGEWPEEPGDSGSVLSARTPRPRPPQAGAAITLPDTSKDDPGATA